MSEADRIWDELDSTYAHWRLNEIPFSESASILRQSQLREVFTGRERELREVLNLLKAAELQTESITPDVLQQGLEYANQQLRGQPGLTAEDYYVLDLVLEKGVLSDATVTLADLERVRAKEFSEILPILEKLVQLDLMRRLPTEHVVGYEPTPMLVGKQEKPEQEKLSGED